MEIIFNFGSKIHIYNVRNKAFQKNPRRTPCMNKDECVQLLKKYKDILKGKYGITSLSLFGSTARGEQTANSDIDLFVDTETPNPFLLMDAKEFLEKETGSSVDIIRNHQNLNPRLKKRILKDGIFIF